MWTNAQQKSFERAIATVEANRAKLERLEEIARVAPQYAERVKDLRTQLDYLETVSKVALAMQGR